MRVFLSGLFFLFFSLGASPTVELEIKCSVDRELNLERVDDQSSIDIFSRKEIRYRVVSNVDADVEVTFISQNDWVLKSDDRMKEIPYHGAFFAAGVNSIVDSDKISEIIPRDKIRDKVCEFSVIFSPKNLSKQYPAGKFSDKITISLGSK